MEGRSRRRANAAAAAALQAGAINDKSVLAVLTLWRFKKNTVRQNVLPVSQSWVYSDTLGLVRCRDGRLAVTKPARTYQSVLELFAAWLRQLHPVGLQFPFCFTSVNVNYNFAARRHRDANNVGPSLTRSLGDFSGGRLLYWQDDDGSAELNDLEAVAPMAFDTKDAPLLFDGRRAHAVEAFCGERYSLVFFTCCWFANAAAETRAQLAIAGVPFPDARAMEHYTRLLAPPLGYERRWRPISLPAAFGLAEPPKALHWPAPVLLNLPDNALKHILGYVLRPEGMAVLSAVNKRLSAGAWSTQAWEGVGVETEKLSPGGHLARRHFTLWSTCAFVVGGAWQQANLALLMSQRFATWQWSQKFLHLRGRWVQVSQTTVPRKIVARAGGRVPSCPVAFGIATSRCPHEIMTAYEGRDTVLVRPSPPSEQRVDFCWVMLSPSEAVVTFCWNNTKLGSASSSPLRSFDIISFAHTRDGLRLTSSGAALDAECLRGDRELGNGLLFAVAVFEQIERPSDSMFLPCWTIWS